RRRLRGHAVVFRWCDRPIRLGSGLARARRAGGDRRGRVALPGRSVALPRAGDRAAPGRRRRTDRARAGGLVRPRAREPERRDPRRGRAAARARGRDRQCPCDRGALRLGGERRVDRVLGHRSTANAMLTVVRYTLIRSPSTTALMETTSAPLIPRSVFAASWTAASAAFAKLSGDEPMIVITFAMSAISAL